MILLHQSPGLANMLYEFFAAYALAKELGEELRIDITYTLRKRESYVLDLLALPETKKVYRLPADPEHLNQGDPLSTAPEFRNGSVTLVQPGIYNGPETDDVFFYHSLEEAKEIRRRAGNKNLILNGYFFDWKYYGKYWQELRSAVRLKEETPATRAFERVIAGHDSVGLHIRRGDFQVASFAVPIERDFWRAAVVLLRELLDDPVFMVFSDDIDYAVSVLGVDSRIFYVKFMGTQRADLEEFICLSKCDHRVLTVKSSFSDLADALHGGTRIAVYKGINPISEAIEKEKSNRARNLQAEGMRRVLLYPDEIAARAAMYATDGKKPWMSDSGEETNSQSAENVMESLAIASVLGGGTDVTSRETMLYRKMAADHELQNYEEAYEDAQRIYVSYASQPHYQAMLRDILRKLGYEHEAAIEEVREGNARYHFLIAPYLGFTYSNYCISLVELGNILYHMGNQVTYLFDTDDKGEIWYIRNNQNYVSRREGKKGGRQFLIPDLVEEYGSLSQALRQIDSDKTDKVVLITRSVACLEAAKEAGGIATVFPDFSDERCIEGIYGNMHMEAGELFRLYQEADIVLSHQYRGKNACDWQDRGNLDYIGEIDNDSKVINLGRHYQPLYVGMAFTLQKLLLANEGNE